MHKDVLYFFVTLPIEKMYSVVPEFVNFPFLSSYSKSYIKLNQWGVIYLSEDAESVLDGNDQNKGEET